jgi:hypothetical protein
VGPVESGVAADEARAVRDTPSGARPAAPALPYIVAMAGPTLAPEHSVHRFGARDYTVMFDGASTWQVFDEDRYLGLIRRTPQDGPVRYDGRAAGEEHIEPLATTDDWRAVLLFLAVANA